jgi:hypothetical protein
MDNQRLYAKIIEKVLEDVDPDIREVMLKYQEGTNYQGFELLPDPLTAILKWQELRNFRKLKKVE